MPREAIKTYPLLSFTREKLFALLFATAVVNVVIPALKGAFHPTSLAEMLLSIGGINIFVWLAVGLGLKMALRHPSEPITQRDVIVTGIFSILVLWPLYETSAIALTFLSGYILIAERQSIFLRASAFVFMAVIIRLFWANLVAAFWGGPLENFDTYAISLVTGMKALGNVIYFGDGSGTIVMAWGCSSFANASMIFLIWAALTRSVRPLPQRSELWIVGALIASVFVINSVRVLLMMKSKAQFEIVHGPIGSSAVNYLLLATALSWTLFGLRRELFH